jgi:hypothetical protein
VDTVGRADVACHATRPNRSRLPDVLTVIGSFPGGKK